MNDGRNQVEPVGSVGPMAPPFQDDSLVLRWAALQSSLGGLSVTLDVGELQDGLSSNQESKPPTIRN